MKILAISDTPSKALWDYCSRERLAGVDLILSCGDLPKKYLEYITNFTAAPILYVHGNHDGCYRTEGEPGGCICVDDQVYVWKGLRIMGLGGSIRYNREETFQYTEREMRRRVRRPGGGGRGGVRRRAHPCFIGEHAALEAAGQRLADGVAHRAGGGLLPAEGAAKDGGENRRQGGDVPQAYEQAGGDPQQRHKGNDPLHQTRHAA